MHPAPADALVRTGTPRLVHFDGAWVTPMRRPVEREFTGEVWTRHLHLVPWSLRSSANAMYTHVPRPPDPDQRARAGRLRGTHLFAGHVFGMFGHDLLELGTRLWPLLRGDLALDGLVVLPWRRRGEPQQLPGTTPTREILEALGYDGPVHVVAGPVQVDRLLVPEHAWVINDHALPVAREVLQTVGRVLGGEPGGTRRVFLSRRRLESPSRSPHEALLEEVATGHGYEVVHPETLPFAEQVRLLQEAGAVAGLDGSALHLAAFCAPRSRVTAFDTRLVRNQLILEELMGLDAVHVDLAALADAPAPSAREAFVQAFREDPDQD